MARLFANNATAKLASAINETDNALLLETGSGAKFPSPTGGDFFDLTLTQAGQETSWEIVKVTARVGDTLTIVRAQQGTTAALWEAGDKAELRLTAGGVAPLGADGKVPAENMTTTDLPLTTPTITGAREVHVHLGSGTNIDLAAGNYFTRTISGTTAFTISNVPAAGTAVSFVVDLINAGGFSVSWWPNLCWSGGVAPPLTVSGRDKLVFSTTDGGANWDVFLVGKDVK